MQNFFEKLSNKDTENILKKGIFEKPQLTVDGRSNQPVRIAFSAVEIETSRKLYIIPQEIAELKDKLCAFSFRIGTRVYFFKDKVLQDGKGFYLPLGFELLELRRRRHVRFDVPESYEHECSIITSANKSAKVEAKLLNFSESGAKLAVGADLALYQKGGGVIVSFKVGRRAAFLVGCQIRFVSRKLTHNTELGVEFTNLTETKKSRILNICEDLTRMLVQTTKRRK